MVNVILSGHFIVEETKGEVYIIKILESVVWLKNAVRWGFVKSKFWKKLQNFNVLDCVLFLRN